MSTPVNPDLKAIGTRIKILRIQNDPDQTQAELGEKLGFSGNMISKIERGRSEPTLKFLLRFSELTGANIDWIVKGEEKT